jgi:hypothetical protein
VRDLVWSGWLTLLALTLVGVLAMPATISTKSRLLATYLITTTQLPPILTLHGAALEQIAVPYITATAGTPPQPITEVQYPAAWFPISGPFALTSLNQSELAGLAALQHDIEGDMAPVVFGYSQGATVIALYKRAFNAQYANPAPGQTVPIPTYVEIGNPSRPNGGLFERLFPLYIPLLDTPFNGATPTETAGAAPGQITTYDIVHQYDFFADFPNRPLNPFAMANAALGAYFGHGTYNQIGMSDAILQDTVGDTAFYMIPQRRLPLLQPLALLGVPDPILAVFDAPLRVLVESAYDRTISPGQPTGINLVPIANPLRTGADFAMAVPTGLDDALQELGLGRPFGTTAAAGPYGVGGPPVALPGAAFSTSTTTAALASTTDLATAHPAAARTVQPANDETSAQLVAAKTPAPRAEAEQHDSSSVISTSPMDAQPTGDSESNHETVTPTTESTTKRRPPADDESFDSSSSLTSHTETTTDGRDGSAAAAHTTTTTEDQETDTKGGQPSEHSAAA